MTELIRLKMKLNKGDKCRVRRHDGSISDAYFDCESEWEKCYWVYLMYGKRVLACNKSQEETDDIYELVVFVGPSCEVHPV